MSDPMEQDVLDEEATVSDGQNGGADVEGGEEADGSGGLEDIQPTIPEQVTFLSHLRSPIVELNIGSGEDDTTLYAHQGLLVSSPYFAEQCAQFGDDVTDRRIDLPDDDVTAVSSVLEYLYRRDYFPTLSDNGTLEYDPGVPQPDDDGVGLLRHARVYTLAQRFGLSKLSSLAHRKIHMTQSTAKGEIAYARFVYKETSPEDENIRKPVATFWATRSHVLRHDAETEFKQMCLEHPQFGFDVLNLVLDAQEKRTGQRQPVPTVGAGRKRQRVL